MGRVLGSDGQFQVVRNNAVVGFLDGFTELTTMSVGRLLITIFLGYFFLNALFAALYMAVGVEHIGNADLGSPGGRWMTAIGMSLETLTTVGYGSVYPASPGVWWVAGIEGVFGILGFSLIGAVIFARFARPTAKLAHGEQALLAPYKEGWSIQMRVANRRRTLLSEVEARLMLVMAEVESDAGQLSYYQMPLELDRVSYLPLTWTLVHALNAESPLAGLSPADLEARRAEMILTIKGLDEVYMQPVISRKSYRWDELVWGGRFVRAFSAKNGAMHLEVERISEHVRVEAPEQLPF